jgi:hypothetical protein
MHAFVALHSGYEPVRLKLRQDEKVARRNWRKSWRKKEGRLVEVLKLINRKSFRPAGESK